MLRTALAFALATLAATAGARAARIYYTDQPAGAGGSILSVAPEGGVPSTVVSFAAGSDLRGLAWHAASGRIFFLDNGAKLLRSILSNGSGQQNVAAVAATLVGSDVEIDDGAAKLYWTEHNTGTTGSGFIRRANLDGTAAENVVTTAPGIGASPYFLFLDPPAGHLYWGVQENPAGGSQPTSFRRHTLAGAADPTFVTITTTTRTRDLAIDPATATAYWNDRQTGTILRRALSGGANQTVFAGLNAPHGLAMDAAAKKLYWADTGQRGSGPLPPNTSSRRVARCNFDGSEFEPLTPAPAGSTNEPWDLALDLATASYAEWRARFFSTAAALAGPLEDADGDGAPNFLECALAAHPRQAGSRPQFAASGGGLAFHRRRGSNLTYRIEVSPDLATWRWNGDATGLTWTVENSVAPVDAEFDRVTILPGLPLAAAAQVFFRLTVSAP